MLLGSDAMNIGIIPARWGSTRFPGKPLAPILGKPMVQWVYDAASCSKLDRAYVVTDDMRIVSVAPKTMLCPHECSSGTVRVYKGITTHLEDGRHGLPSDDVVLNIQGDEPCVTPDNINVLIDAMQDAEVATLASPISYAEALDPNIVKVVVDDNSNALYFSRLPIPYGSTGNYLQHIGIYGYKYSMLKRFCEMGSSSLEEAEKLEQLRLLQAGIKIKVVTTDYCGVGVDVPEDIPKAEAILRNRQVQDGWLKAV